jgi:alpha-beta hydrolase superfamily lysophospholipase
MVYSEYNLVNPDNFSFFVRKWTPDTPPKGLIVLLHGLSDHGSRFVYVAEKFVSDGYIFIAPDLRGNGKTGGKRGHFDSLTQVMSDISFLLSESRKTHPDLPLTLYSQSMGGNLAINFALRFPDEIDFAIVSSPWLRLTKQPSAFLQKVASTLAHLFPSLLLPNGINSKDLCHDPEIYKAYDTDPLIHWKVSVSTFTIINSSGEWSIANAASLKIPMLLLHSEADPITSFKASREFAENANAFLTFIPYKTQFHELHNEPEKEEVCGKMVEWLGLNVSKA